MSTSQNVYWIGGCKSEYGSIATLTGLKTIRLLSFSDSADFLATCAPDIRGCAILERKLPSMDGLELLKEMHRRGFTLPVIFLTRHGTIPDAVQSIKAGAHDFLSRPAEPAVLQSSIHAALEQDAKLFSDQQDQLVIHCKLATLTEREREIMMLAVSGNTNKEIAQQLEISHRTVEIHRARILQKTGMTNMLELVRRSGMLKNINDSIALRWPAQDLVGDG